MPGENGPRFHVQTPMFEVPAEWTLPKDLPDLSSAAIIGLDTETRDPQLKSKGPGVRRDGYMVGISVAVPEGRSWYLPFGHAEGQQFSKDAVLRWARDNLCKPGQPKVGANILYDLDYLYHEGVPVSGPFHDVQLAEPLIDENRRTYALDALATKYLGERKRVTTLADACSNWGLKGDPQAHIWRLDPKYTGEYAEGDAEQTLEIFRKQEKILREQELEDVYDIESRLVPMLLHMRQIGVPLDVDKLLELHESKSQELEGLTGKLEETAGQHVDIWAAESIASVFDALNLEYPLTPKTRKPSFVKGWLERHDNEIAKLIVKCRELDKMRGTFLEGSMLEMMINNRIHCQFNQLRSDDSGTVTGRFSSSNPNLQFIPIRTPEGKEIRQVFIPDPDFWWAKADYSQIEIRILAHYAMGKGSKDIVEAFCKNPKIDYHQWCADIAKVSRRFAKTINFGLIYGMGKDKLAKELGITVEEAMLFMDLYFKTLPFVKETVDTATDVAQRRGYVKTILGRRRRFDLWEPRDKRLARSVSISADKDEILQKIEQFGTGYWKGVQRAGCHKAFNAADQGSAADIMKIAMVKIWEAGLCNVIRPYITVHDELDFGYPRNKQGVEALKEIKYLMETAYKLKVPTVVDMEIGPNWGAVKDFEFKEAA